MSPIVPHLFVYGTLKSPFQGNRFAQLLRREGHLLGPAKLPGRLYGLRRYPCVRPPLHPRETVRGELYRLRKPAELLPLLDEYENHLYRRILTKVYWEAGRAAERAWIYQFTRPLARHRRVRSGDWPESELEHLVRGLRPETATPDLVDHHARRIWHNR